MSTNNCHSVTWTVLLGRWIEFARSALALPKDLDGQRLGDSVPDIIVLQAVWFSLEHLDELNQDDRALALDHAEVLKEKHGRAIGLRWPPDSLPKLLQQLIDDAKDRLAARRNHLVPGRLNRT